MAIILNSWRGCSLKKKIACRGSPPPTVVFFSAHKGEKIGGALLSCGCCVWVRFSGFFLSRSPLGRFSLLQGGLGAGFALVGFAVRPRLPPFVLGFRRSSLFWLLFFGFFLSSLRGLCFFFSCWGGSSACCFCPFGGCFFCWFFRVSLGCAAFGGFCPGLWCCVALCLGFGWLCSWLRLPRPFCFSFCGGVAGFCVWCWSRFVRSSLFGFCQLVGFFFLFGSCFFSCGCLPCWLGSFRFLFRLFWGVWFRFLGGGCVGCWFGCSCCSLVACGVGSACFVWFRSCWWWFLCFSPFSRAFVLAWFFFGFFAFFHLVF